MIKLEHTITASPEQIMFVIEGMRNPHNSWNNIDSCITYSFEDVPVDFELGNNDLDLMKRLSKAGTDHRKFMRMLPVMVRITAPLYWWSEYDTYKVGTVANSTSKMHKIHSKKFTFDDFSCEHLSTSSKSMMALIIEKLNMERRLYNASKDKDIWWQLIQLLPSSYNQTRNVMLNYEVLANMYHSRKSHKLDEWRTFCEWVKELPYSELITGEE